METFILIILFCLLILFSTIYVTSFFKDNENNRVRTFVLKIICAVLFVLIGLTSLIYNSNTDYTQNIIFIGLVGCLIGDVLLGLRRITKHHDLFLLLGMLVFVLAHIAYDFSFVINFNNNYFYLLLIVIVLMAGFMVLTKYTNVDFEKMQIPCYIYMLSSSIMLAISIYGIVNKIGAFSVVMFIGILLFVISDVLLCYTYFNKNKNNDKVIKFFSSYTYFIGQGLIALTILLF